MIITKTPFRVSLFGGGTDHPAWYLENGGSVLSFAIDKYSYISLRELPPFFEHKFRVSYSINELVSSNSEIKHPAVREAFKKFAPELNLELLHHGDLPARSGIGSSSAFSVGLIHSIYALKGASILPEELANLAIEFEQKILQENVGSQDQIACSLGGINFIEFGPGPYWKNESLSLDLSDSSRTNLNESGPLGQNTFILGISNASARSSREWCEGPLIEYDNPPPAPITINLFSL